MCTNVQHVRRKKTYELFRIASKRHWRLCTIYSEDTKDTYRKKTEVIEVHKAVYTLKKYRHSDTRFPITQTPRGARHPDKTGSLRPIYSHLMHSESPITGCVGS